MRRLAGVVTIAGLGALLVAASPAAATAGDDARIVLETRSISSGGTEGLPVHCGPGERAIGGGTFAGSWLAQSGPLDANGLVSTTRDGSVPVSWLTTVHNGTAQSREFRFYAVCSASSDATVQHTEVRLAAAPDNLNPTRGDAAVECPAGQRVIGGGVTYSFLTSGTRIDASGPLDETGATANTVTGDVARYWYAAVRNFDPTPPGQYYGIYAVCSSSSLATLKTVVVGTNDNIERSVVCPTGSRATGGGAVPVDDIVTSISDSTPTDALGSPFSLFNADVPRGWLAVAANDEDISNAPISHSVVCDPETPVATPPPGATGERAAALKKCKKKKGKRKRKKCRKKANALPL